MSLPKQPPPAKLITGLLISDFSLHEETLKELCELFGPFDFLSEPKPFSYTSYYQQEMGIDIHRQFCSFSRLVSPEKLPDIKHETNQLEKKFARSGKRVINIDPGILSEERLVLATGKNYTHRIYLRNGIYADLTLIFQKGTYRALPWTYPDYKEEALIKILKTLRQKLLFERSGRLPHKQ